MTLLPSYHAVKSQWPLLPSQYTFIQNSRNTVQRILDGTDRRLLLIVGPCSIHDRQSALEYAKELKWLANEVSDTFYLLMRTYVEKARSGLGWKGFLYDPHLDGSYDISTGVSWTRQLLLDLISMEVPTATEFLDHITSSYYDDLIVWGSIGARTASSQPHRQLASLLNMPVGIKNCVAGRVSAAVQGCVAASQSHSFIGLNSQGQPCIVKTTGNPNVHVVLRGSENQTNYDKHSIQSAVQQLEQYQLPKRVLIDCSHGNSRRQPFDQLTVFQNILDQVREGCAYIRGALIESHLIAGNQKFNSNPSSLKYGVSITDACVDWQSTRQLILQAAQKCTNAH